MSGSNREISEMDFELTDEERKFKEDLCDFLDREVTKEIVEESELGLGYGPHSWELIRKLGAKGWLAPTFPKEYGGLGLPYVYRYILLEELDYRDALVVVRGMGSIAVDMVGPTILRYGSEEIKKEFLPRIARGEIDFALGYTEPDAGSDLSRISIRAVEDGDYFVINGQKIFNTSCHFARYHWLATRTDPDALPHKGISLIIVDLTSPGITIEPMWEMSGTRTNQVFYDDVRVPKRYLVGRKNHGWYYMASALDLERMLTVGNLQRSLDELIAHTNRSVKGGTALSKIPWVRQILADLSIEINVARNLARKVVCIKDKGKVPNHESAVLKVFVSELDQRVAQLGLEVLGLTGQLAKDSKYSVLDGRMVRSFLSSFLITLGAGSSEVLRNIIALRALGLPREGDESRT
jgi:3-oxocholest-4-en-26-oyl-CoA dehydrogenase alpha subunit